MEIEFKKALTPQPQKSTFINVLSWIFIVFGGFAIFIGILQNIMIHMVFQKEKMSHVMQQAEATEHIPAFALVMLNHFDLVVLLLLLVSVISFISAIALLKRKNWARIVFIILMSVGIAWNVVSLVIQLNLFSSMPEMAGGQAPPPEFQDMMQIMKIASVIMVVGISALFGFVIKKLCSKNIKEEFS